MTTIACAPSHASYSSLAQERRESLLNFLSSYRICDSGTCGSNTHTLAFSPRRVPQMSMAGDSRVSPVSALNAKPRTAIFLELMVLNMVWTTSLPKRSFWWSFILMTCIQYAATWGRPAVSHRYTRLRMSFWKQLPPNPGLHLRNFAPTPGSELTTVMRWSMSAPEASQMALNALTLEMRWARSAFAISFDSSALHTLAVMMLERGTQRAYNEASASTADRPSRVC
mmetsp:Transcript_1787/g.3959  ORF Transcript_1787/g.3959 Transcript_1787/m.3959 type:complete len:226 (-) Transcript_1787:610-1287(-)